VILALMSTQRAKSRYQWQRELVVCLLS